MKPPSPPPQGFMTMKPPSPPSTRARARQDKDPSPSPAALDWGGGGVSCALGTPSAGRGSSTTEGGRVVRVVARGNKSSEPRLNLSGSWQQGHSAAYNTPFHIQVVCKGFIARGQEIVIAHGSCSTRAHGFPRAVDRSPSGMDSSLEAFSYNPAHGSFATLPDRAVAIPMVRIGGSSRTEPNYRRKTSSSRVKLTCLTTV